MDNREDHLSFQWDLITEDFIEKELKNTFLRNAIPNKNNFILRFLGDLTCEWEENISKFVKEGHTFECDEKT